MFPRGSEWRKWDLHIHAPFGTMADGYLDAKNKDIWSDFCKKLEESDVDVFGITDYFSASNYYKFLEEYKKRYPSSKKTFFLNIELRLNESVNKKLEEVNIHLIFNPLFLNKLDKFLNKLEVTKTGDKEASIYCSELKVKSDFESATVTRENIKEAVRKTFGEKAVRQNYLLVVTAANDDGLRAERGVQRKEVISDEIDKFSDMFFGGSQNIKYFLDTSRLEDDKQTIGKKTVISGSDSHSFDDLEKLLGKYVVETDKTGKEIVNGEPTWIKADTTFEGLKQIIYEPEPGERVKIGVVKPDQKDDFRVISKIKFEKAKNFPTEIEFNNNLCSIIGSRSSGKSALLAYIAHSIDTDLAESTKPEGPGAGYPWSNIDFEYSIEWANGQLNHDSPGKIIYIPQGYLFETSKRPDEIKEKIEPVLFKKIPAFEEKYKSSLREINEINNNISRETDNWFLLSGRLTNLELALKDIGDKTAVEKEMSNVESNIEKLRKENKLTEGDVQKFQVVSAELSKYKNEIQQVEKEALQISSTTNDYKKYFGKLDIQFVPSLDNLPQKLIEQITKDKSEILPEFLDRFNKQVIDYYRLLEVEKQNLTEKSQKLYQENKSLITKYEKNMELQTLVGKFNGYKDYFEKIQRLEKEKQELSLNIKTLASFVATEIKKRVSVLDRLTAFLKGIDQTNYDVTFGIESGFSSESIKLLTQKVNTKFRSEFLEDGQLKIPSIRENPFKFLSQMYSGVQKINQDYDEKDVSIEALLLTEKILFNAEMEGDKIGGFQNSTMTPGKQALFALKLILDESDETWPLLIDQPEDDLDSRSIYDSIVPFLKRKKKERQIIMVSHNANLVIGSDSEQIIVANRNGKDRINEDGLEFNYLGGSIENTKEKDHACHDTLRSQGIREHACEILDGGKEAFEHRRNKYNLTEK